MLPDRMLPFWDAENNAIPVEKAFPKSIMPSHWVDPVCGYKWVQRIGAFTLMFQRMDEGLRRSVCPACEGNVLIAGRNDLSTTHPELVKLWDELNTIPITTVSKGSAKVVLWRCEQGHTWKSKVKDQVVRGDLCRKCNPQPYTRRNSILLQDSHPELYNEIVSIIDDGVKMETLTSGSTRLVKWRCSQNHTFTSTVTNRTLLGRGCPYCAGRYAIPGENDIATTNPEVMPFWDYEANVLKPEKIKKSTNKELHWKCEKNHRWLSIPHNLTDKRQFCPFCSGKRMISGETDFASVYPDQLKLWNYEKNSILPQDVSAGNGQIVHWICSFGHQWEASVYSAKNRTKSSGCAICSGIVVLEDFNDVASQYPHLLSEWNYDKNEKKPTEYSSGSGYMAWWKCSKAHEWQTQIDKRTGNYSTNCPECAAGKNVSKAEKIISDYISTLLPNDTVLTSSRKVIKGFELDIYIPNKKIAVEYNGVYWHSEVMGKYRTYHYDKWKACKDKGIQLIQIWEDEWNRNPEQIKRMLAHKLGVSNERKVFARKTTVVELAKIDAESFLEENHIQGYASGSYYLGLKDKITEEIVSVLVLKKEARTNGKTLNIIRYATSANVVGGFTKLLKYAQRLYSPDSFITFSDHCVSDGGLYENNGFVADKELPPDYMYVVGSARHHKFGYRLKRFKNDPTLLWEEGLTERELADLNGLKRIWDAGKTRWILTK